MVQYKAFKLTSMKLFPCLCAMKIFWLRWLLVTLLKYVNIQSEAGLYNSTNMI